MSFIYIEEGAQSAEVTPGTRNRMGEQLNKAVLTFFKFFFLPRVPRIYSRISASSAKYALKNPPRVSWILLYATTIKSIFQRSVLFWYSNSNSFFQKHKCDDLPVLGVTLQPYKMQCSIGLRIWVIEFVFFCIGVAILPANIVESTVRAMITPHDWQGIEGDSFRGVGVMINGIECKRR